MTQPQEDQTTDAGTASAAPSAGLPAPGAVTAAGVQAPGPQKDKGRLVFAAGGLGLGLVAGLLLGQIEFPSASGSAIAEAVESCGASASAGISMLDEGRSISMKTSGAESGGAEYADVVCVLESLEMPQSVISRMGSTRALDGRQNGEWDRFSASWGYHPDNGLDIVVEVIDQK